MRPRRRPAAIGRLYIMPKGDYLVGQARRSRWAGRANRRRRATRDHETPLERSGRRPDVRTGRSATGDVSRLLALWERQGYGIGHLGIDQLGARIGGDGLDIRDCQLGLLVDGVEQTDVSFRNVHHSGNKVSFRVVGGPAAAAGKPTTARTVLFGGASSGNDYAYDVANGGRLIAQDIWYEGAPPTFLKMSGFGTFTLSGAMIASGRPRTKRGPHGSGLCRRGVSGFPRHRRSCRPCSERVSWWPEKVMARMYCCWVPSHPTKTCSLHRRRQQVSHYSCLGLYARSEEGEPPTRSVPDYGTPDAKWITSMLERVHGHPTTADAGSRECCRRAILPRVGLRLHNRYPCEALTVATAGGQGHSCWWTSVVMISPRGLLFRRATRRPDHEESFCRGGMADRLPGRGGGKRGEQCGAVRGGRYERR